MARLFSIKPGITFKGREFRGLRGWAGKPLHPPLTDFPIACYVLAAVFDVISYLTGSRDFFVAATYVVVAGALVSVATALTGFWDWWKGLERVPSGRAKHNQVWRTANWHMAVMLTVTAIVLLDIGLRLAQFDEAYPRFSTLVLSVLAAALVAYGATYGGSLVFDYQFNVETLEGSTVGDETEKDQLPGDKGRKG